jgi:zinc/manganese transport system substrate-binding protein
MASVHCGRQIARMRLAMLATVLAAVPAVIFAAIAAPAAHVRAQDDAPLKVVVTFSILADWVQNVGGEHVEVATIVPAGGDAHTFDPDPSQVASIADADVIFAIGPNFEPWLEDMIASSGSSATYVEVSTGITLLDDAHAGEGEEDHADEEVHDHGDADPHIWGNVANAITAAETIRASLAEADDANADAYQANADAYTEQLTGLDASIREKVATIPEEKRKLVTTHDTFRYYADAYGFEILGTALGSVSTEAGDPSAQDIAALVESIEAAGVPAIFAENVVNPALMQSIADEAGVTLAPTLYTDALGEEGSPGDTYIGMMTYNTDTIVAALSGQ